MSERILSTERSENDRNKLIRTFTGRYVNPLALRVEDVCIEDIAHHLSNECRYAGACPVFYSVAQHSVLVSQYFGGPAYKLAGLLHDAAEAYLKDIPSPIKHDPRMAWYRAVEDGLLAMIFRKFGIDPAMADDVKGADIEVFKREVFSFWEGGEEFGIAPWTPDRAERTFLQAFHQYQDMRKL